MFPYIKVPLEQAIHICHPLSKQKVVKCDKSKIQSCHPSLHKRSVMPSVSKCGNRN